ncbi:MAG TPA: DEAD/DEAH box helicase family protein [Ignavibacteriales bacterium]|nr:DEAD/DEAH box helicase family protein [Ignavibacteriales bacterium]HOL82209.1 DEAD/DEAH box helicase family protein [Ignavibacteriales bacterium]HPD68011.1 DEAD/DEAH box helicase family protein [Ignavibacteriales bacterium]HPP34574.1 DEAD/DEAH box helicase family protein [Ignavibacteriales bacterium]HRR18034.1 DEAD/DEAH box helicase family protein [Ignavibacteriales bacterium]
MTKNKYKRIFNPEDFDLVISDEAHRTIGGNSSAVFEYFVGYKLGLTATPKDYLKNIDISKFGETDPRSVERRILLDTYKTFGCDSGEPTFRHSLIDGVKDAFLINPIVIDARTDITTQLISKQGYAVTLKDDKGKDVEEVFLQKDFEKKILFRKYKLCFLRNFS